MSIIEETLRNLQERQNGVTGGPEIASIELTQSAIDRVNEKGRKLQRLKRYIVFVIVAAAIGFAANTVLDRQLNSMEEQKRESILAMNATQEKLTTASAVPDEKTVPELTDESEIIPPVIAVAEEPEQLSPVVPKSAELPPEPLVMAAAGESFQEYGWIKKGWMAVNDNEHGGALAVWKEGFLSIPDRQIVLVMHIAVDRTKSIKFLQKLGEGHAAFVVSAKFKGIDSYYILSAPPIEALEAERAEIGSILGLDNLKGNHKEKILARMLVEASVSEPDPAPVTAAVPDPPIVIAKEKETVPARLLPEEKPAPPVKEPPLNMEETINVARKHVHSGSYSEAVKILTPVIDGPERTWEAYLLIGMAHLGLDELGLASEYLDKGLAITEKQPALWLQRAIVEQEKGEHENALQTLRRGEKVAPAMPELQLNIGYSHDGLGNVREAEIAYRSFMNLTDGKPEYMEIRRKVQERLLKLGR